MGTFRKLLRRTFYTAAAVSTLLLLATLILWPVSYYLWADAFYGFPGKKWCAVGVDSGRAFLFYKTPYKFATTISPVGLHFFSHQIVRGDGRPGGDRWSYFNWNTPDSQSAWGEDARTSLGVLTLFVRGDFTAGAIYIPFSYLALLFAILPLLALHSIRRHRKLARVGLCSKCGYDLRAHALGEKCPECGTVVTRSSVAEARGSKLRPGGRLTPCMPPSPADRRRIMPSTWLGPVP